MKGDMTQAVNLRRGDLVEIAGVNYKVGALMRDEYGTFVIVFHSEDSRHPNAISITAKGDTPFRLSSGEEYHG